MKNIFTFLFVIIANLFFSQNLDKLRNSNGFREIKLGTSITNYPNFVKKSKENQEYFGAWGWNYDYILDQGNDEKYDKLGNTKIYRVFAKVIKNNIYEISLALDKNHEVIEMLEYAYGKPTFENKELGIKRWKIDNIECELQGFSTELVYSHYYINYIDTNLRSIGWEEEREQKRNKAISEL